MSCWARFGEKTKELDDEGDEKGVEVFKFLKGLTSITLNISEPDTPFHPMFVFPPTLGFEGGRGIIPDDFSEDLLATMSGLVSSTTHPLMRARFADVLWVRRQGYKFACIAHEAYLASAEDRNLSHETNSYLIRAYQLSRELNNSSMLEKANLVAEETLLRYVDNFRQWIWRAIDLHIHLTDCYGKNADNLIASLRSESQVAEENRNFTYSENIHEQAIALLKAAKAFKKVERTQVDAAEAFSRYAIESAKDNKFGSAVHFTEKSIGLFRNVGGHREQVDKLQILLREHNKGLFESIEWKEITVGASDEYFELLNMRTNDLLDQLDGETLYESLLVLCRFISSPEASAIAAVVERADSEHVMTKLSSSKTFDDDGNVLSKDESPTAPCGHLAFHRGDTYFSLIAPAVEKIMAVHDVTLNDLVAILQECPFVPSDRQKIFARGLLAGLHSDFLLVAHLLPPQLEHALRQMLVATGEITSELTDAIIESEYPLGTIIRCNKLEEMLGEDFVLDLSCLLAKSPGSLNLRNRMSHGLLSDKNFLPIQDGQRIEIQADIMYLWSLTLKLCLLLKPTT